MDTQQMKDACLAAEKLLGENEADVFDAGQAVVYAYDEIGLLREVTRHDDAYQAMMCAAFRSFEHAERGIVVTTCGWASPITDEAPSQHPDRRRCFMAIACDRQFTTLSLVRFQDTGEEMETDGGEGQIADAIKRTVLLMSLVTVTRGADVK